MKSMTGYGRAQFRDDNYEIEIEIRSVNSRFLDLRIKQPYYLSFLETEISKLVSKELVRGKVDIFINMKILQVPDMELNEELAKSYWNIYAKAKDLVGINTDLPFTKLLSEKDVISIGNDVINEDSISKIVLNTLGTAINQHQKMARREGESMKAYCSSSLSIMKTALKNIENEFPIYKEESFIKLKENIQKLMGKFLEEEDHKRLLIESAIYIEKADITEEIVRLHNHLDKFVNLLDEKKELGKKLNFILQEMHREINTIGSKFNTTKTFDDIILIKEEIEKCREIIQNVR